MLDAYQPMQLLLALWPTADFELPADGADFGQRITAQFPIFQNVQIVQVQGGPAPAELPRLALTDHGRRWVLELAPARVSLRRLADGPAILGGLLDELRAMVLPMHAWLAENANLRVYRAGLVTDLFCNTRSSASEKIAHYFLQSRVLQGTMPTEVHLALHNRLVLGESPGTPLMINRWLRIQPMRTRDPRHLDFAAQVQVDLNTMAEDTQVKTGRDLAAFLDAVRNHLEGGIPLLEDVDFLA